MKVRKEIGEKATRSEPNARYSAVGFGLKLFLVFGLAFASGIFLFRQGFHHDVKYFLQGRFDELHEGAIKDAVLEVSDQLQSEVDIYIGNDLPSLFLDIPFENFQLIQAKRNEAVENGILLSSDDDFVSATVRYGNSAPIKVKIRLKGDWSDHLSGNKWSYRIHILDEQAIEGMRRISIQAPETRNYIYEWAYHQTLMQENILTPRYFFINVILNGENKGIYAMEESFYTDLMESQQRRAGVILKFDETDLWENWATYFSVGKEDLQMLAQTSGYFMHADYASAHVSGFASGSLQSDPVLLAQYRTGQSMLRAFQTGELSAAEVFDLENLGTYLAVTELWGAGHAFDWQNLRFYYNPVTSLLEPIGFDGLAMNQYYASLDLESSLNQCILFQDEAVWPVFYQAASPIFQPEYLLALQDRLNDPVTGYASALDKEYKFDTAVDWGLMMERVDRLHAELELLNRARQKPAVDAQ
jgi:hypothetical protein